MAHDKPQGRFTLQDYLAWPDDERWEVIDGEAYAMTPTPSVAHQTVALNLATTLKRHLEGSPCRAFIAPTDVVLAPSDIVQPNVFIVCDSGLRSPEPTYKEPLMWCSSFSHPQQH